MSSPLELLSSTLKGAHGIETMVDKRTVGLLVRVESEVKCTPFFIILTFTKLVFSATAATLC